MKSNKKSVVECFPKYLNFLYAPIDITKCGPNLVHV